MSILNVTERINVFKYDIAKDTIKVNLFAASKSPVEGTPGCCWIFTCCEIGWMPEPLGGSPSGNAGMWGSGLLCKRASTQHHSIVLYKWL